MIEEITIETLLGIDQGLSDELFAVWEASVRATHEFLTEADIERIGEYVPDAFLGV